MTREQAEKLLELSKTHSIKYTNSPYVNSFGTPYISDDGRILYDDDVYLGIIVEDKPTYDFSVYKRIDEWETK